VQPLRELLPEQQNRDLKYIQRFQEEQATALLPQEETIQVPHNGELGYIQQPLSQENTSLQEEGTSLQVQPWLETISMQQELKLMMNFFFVYQDLPLTTVSSSKSNMEAPYSMVYPTLNFHLIPLDLFFILSHAYC
jgi:hypothetical protein